MVKSGAWVCVETGVEIGVEIAWIFPMANIPHEKIHAFSTVFSTTHETAFFTLVAARLGNV